MTTTTNVEQVKLNIMTSSQYSSATKNANELYMLTDATMNYNDLSNKPDLSVYALDTDVVHKTGDETISGKKTFTNNLIRMNTNYTKGTNPSSMNYNAVEFVDSNGASSTANRVGLFETSIGTDGLISTSMASYKYENGSTSNAKIAIMYPTTGDPYTQAPASDVNNSIVTTVSASKLYVGYIKLGNGLIIQRGTASIPANTSSIIITFPTPVTNVDNGSIAITLYGGPNFYCSVSNITTTTFQVNLSNTRPNIEYILWLYVGY